MSVCQDFVHVRHKDGNVLNNKLENLELLSSEQWQKIQEKEAKRKAIRRAEKKLQFEEYKSKIHSVLPLWGYVAGFPQNVNKFKSPRHAATCTGVGTAKDLQGIVENALSQKKMQVEYKGWVFGLDHAKKAEILRMGSIPVYCYPVANPNKIHLRDKAIKTSAFLHFLFPHYTSKPISNQKRKPEKDMWAAHAQFDSPPTVKKAKKQ